MDRNSVLYAVALAGLSLLLYTKGRQTRRNAPGPRRFPIIGSVLQMPTVRPWLVFSEWSKIYGDIIQIDVIGRPIIVLNSVKVAQDLLNKRSSIYSDRPHLVMAGDLVGFGETFALQPYGDNWRRQRRLIAQDFSSSSIPRYHPLQEKEGRTLMRNVLSDPSTLVSEVGLRIGTIIIRVTYGYYVKSADDPFLTLPLAAMADFNEASTPGKFLVDFIPSLQYLPEWVPGTGFLAQAKEWRKTYVQAGTSPYLWSKGNLQTGTALMPNLCGTIIANAGEAMSPADEDTLTKAASSVLGGGLDSNISSALTFFLAMILYPEVQKKAQSEIDTVIGRDRLPSINDRQSLPYVRSVLTEVLRWRPAFPLGLPHALSQDDIYEDILLPKGALLLPNVWHMLYDPEVYPSPEQFTPERYNNSDSEMQKVKDLVFGFGRRVCPGSSFAEATLFSIVATALATCDILPALDQHGKEIIPNVTYSSGTISLPEAFPYRLKPRSSKAMQMLNEVAPGVE